MSADRAALLVTQDIKPVIGVLMKMAGGSQKVADQIDYNDFIQQSIEYKEMAGKLSGKAYKAYLNILRSHPFPVMRASEIQEWSESDEYKSILDDGVPVKNKEIIDNPIPNEVKAISGRPKSISLSWSIPRIANITGYKIYRSKESPNFFKMIYGSKGRERNNFIDKNLEDGIQCFYYISSIDEYNKESEPSVIVSATTKERPVSADKFIVKGNRTRKAELSWANNNIAIETKILVYRCDDLKKNKYRKVATLSSYPPKYVDMKLKDGKEYSYYLRVEEDGLLSNPSKTIEVKTTHLPNCPSKVFSNYNSTSNSIHLKWEAVDEAVSYNIYQRRPIVDKKIATIKRCEYIFRTEMKPDKEISYYIRSVDNAQRESNKSAVTIVKSPKML